MLGITAFYLVKNRYCTDIYFSRETGYYQTGFKLKILGGAGYNIHYTLDGSKPTPKSCVYDKDDPIMIEDASKHENIYSARTDISAAFMKELMEKYSQDHPGYTVPDDLVDKCNIVRAAVYDQEGNCLDYEDAVYFVGFEEKKGYDDIYTVSIVTDPGNLFDYEKGIYTTGAAFDRYMEESLGKDDVWTTWYWWWWDSNYSQGGREWEREAKITVFNDEKKMVLSENCGIRLLGGGSRGLLPKSLGCYAREEYSGSNKFSLDLFDNGNNPHKFVLFSGGDDNIFKLKDYLVNSLTQELNFATMDFISCVLFLNGEYWGTYYMIENYNTSYICDHYGVNKDNIIMFKNGEIKEGLPEDEELYYDMRWFIAPNDMTRADYYEKACEMLDMDSCIDYYASQIYIARSGDWPDTNYALWRTKERENSVYGDCRWRWMLFDVNSGGLDFENLEQDTLAYVLEADALFNSLYQNEDFRLKFVKRLVEIGKEVYISERCEELINSYAETMKEPIMASNLRFYNDTKEDEFDKNVEQMKIFFENRYDVIWNSLVNHVGEGWLTENGIEKE